MSHERKADAFHIVTHQSQSTEIVVSLPSFCKPLAASVRPYGGGQTGLLASYYDPEQHAWVVRHLPLHEAWPHRPPPILVVRVACLVDPTDLYELRVTMSSVLDGIDNDATYALQRRSQLYALLMEEHVADKSGATLEAAAAQGQLPHLKEAVTLAAALEVMEGFVLTGGGFCSDFPVLRDGPALPRSMDAVYDDVLAGDALCGPPQPPSHSPHEPSAGTARPAGAAAAAEEYTAWSVTAAANAGLACFALGLRRRSPLELARESDLASRDTMPTEAQVQHLLARISSAGGGTSPSLPLASNTWANTGLLPDATGLVESRSPSVDGRRSLTLQQAGASRPLLETLMLRGEVKVKVSRKEGESWRIDLPPPHGSFDFAMGTNRELLTIARQTFYCE